MSEIFSSVESFAASVMDTDTLLSLWPLWRKSIFCFAAILAFRYLYRVCVIHIAGYLRNRYKYAYIDDFCRAFNHPIQSFLWILALYSFIVLSPLDTLSQNPAIDKILRSFLVICIIWGVYNLCDAGRGLIAHFVKQSRDKRELTERENELHRKYNETVSIMISTIGHGLCIMLGIAMVAREWNYDITAFVASLGIGAMAIALAAKDSLANIFGSMVILMERPFGKGDWIMANNIEGIVERISFRSTCIRTFYQELVYIPNSLLSNTPITNYTERKKYRIEYNLGVLYSTSRAQLEKVCQELRQLCVRLDEIENGGIDINFFEFGDSALNIHIVCYAATDNRSEYLKIREKFNLNVMKVLEENGVGYAFPSQSIYFETPIPASVAEDKDKQA